MFSKILVANRGEIACRVIATARRMGIRTVAVHSDADSAARHVRLADEALRIGKSPAGESYLASGRILDAALRSGTEAVHPGYGFLSESPEFAEEVKAAGLEFIGPPASAIRAMGLKDAAKEIIAKAGVPVVPGCHDGNQDPTHLARQAELIGFPVMIKARAGGGGRGMRLARNPEEFADALASARREAEAGFGDGAVLLEAFIRRPRHIEFQIFGDRHGNAVHLFERDCSLQRRHQKVIEEAPAPGMPEDVREAMGNAAVNAAKAVGYAGAGTVEFIADGSEGLRADGFWFMEMNTRLQVEHPVTEAITGLDLVELQIRTAAGEPLPFGQSDLSIEGHAIEARICAEDASRGFLPVAGRLWHIRFPDGVEFKPGEIRTDSGVESGDKITQHYDSMVAKLIVHDASRKDALAQLRAALSRTRVAGVRTNLEFLFELAGHPEFCAGEADTGLIGRDLDRLSAAKAPASAVWGLAALSALKLLEADRETDSWRALAGWRGWPAGAISVSLLHDGIKFDIDAECRNDGTVRLSGVLGEVGVSAKRTGKSGYRVRADGLTVSLDLIEAGTKICVLDELRTYEFETAGVQQAQSEAEGESRLAVAPLPGLIKLTNVEAGQAVSSGDILAVLETMKMEHPVTAHRSGVIGEIAVAEGEQVEEGAALMEFEEEGE